jgi:group I intron endonuclease
MLVYLITNKINEKQYVGQTTQSLPRRWKFHCSKNSNCLALKSAIQKYGIDNFSIEIVYTASSLEELNKKEIEFINKFNTLSPNGYNLTTGGLNYIRSEESRKKKSNSRKGVVPWNKGLTKEDPRVASHVSYGENNGSWKNGPMKDKKYSEKTKKQMSDVKKGKKSLLKGRKISEAHKKASFEGRKKIAIVCNETGKTYLSVRLASEDLNIKPKNIYDHLYGLQKQVNGYTFHKVLI